MSQSPETHPSCLELVYLALCTEAALVLCPFVSQIWYPVEETPQGSQGSTVADNVLDQATKQERIQHRSMLLKPFFLLWPCTVNSILVPENVFLWWLQMRSLIVMLMKVRLQEAIPIFYHYDWKLDQVTNYLSEMMKHPSQEKSPACCNHSTTWFRCRQPSLVSSDFAQALKTLSQHNLLPSFFSAWRYNRSAPEWWHRNLQQRIKCAIINWYWNHLLQLIVA